MELTFDCSKYQKECLLETVDMAINIIREDNSKASCMALLCAALDNVVKKDEDLSEAVSFVEMYRKNTLACSYSSGFYDIDAITWYHMNSQQQTQERIKRLEGFKEEIQMVYNRIGEQK